METFEDLSLMSSRAKRGDLKEIASSSFDKLRTSRNDNPSDLRQSPLWADYMSSIGWKVDKTQDHFIFSLQYLFLTFCKIPRFTPDLDLYKADQYLKGKNALLAKLEPDFGVGEGKLKELTKNGFKEDKWSLAPTKTIVIDLKPSPDELLMRMEKDTRYSVRQSEKKGVRVEENNSFDDFFSMYVQTSKRNHFWIESRKQLFNRWDIFHQKGQARILTAKLDKEPLATAMVFYWDQGAYYLHAASSGSKRDLFAPYLLIWELIKDSKKRGFKKLDLEGIYDSRFPTTKSWQGFSHFKKGFRGEELTSLGTFTKVYNPVVSTLFELANRLW